MINNENNRDNNSRREFNRGEGESSSFQNKFRGDRGFNSDRNNNTNREFQNDRSSSSNSGNDSQFRDNNFNRGNEGGNREGGNREGGNREGGSRGFGGGSRGFGGGSSGGSRGFGGGSRGFGGGNREGGSRGFGGGSRGFGGGSSGGSRGFGGGSRGFGGGSSGGSRGFGGGNRSFNSDRGTQNRMGGDNRPTFRKGFCQVKYNGILPTAHFNSAGHDLSTTQDIIIAAHFQPQMVELATRIQPEKGFWSMLTGRSGLNKLGLMIVPGIIDNDYTGTLSAIVYNFSGKEITLHANDKIAQIIFFKQYDPEWMEVENLDDTERGTSGFGAEKIINRQEENTEQHTEEAVSQDEAVSEDEASDDE